MGIIATLLGLRGWRLGGAIAGGLALLAVIALAVHIVRDRARLQGVERRALACEAAVKNNESTVLNCPQSVSDAATRSQRYQACDAAIATGTLYAVQAACSAAVKRRDAQATAFAADLADVTAQLIRARADTTAAISRADARAKTSARKDRDAQAAIAAAPRSPDGRITCDDRCLRALAGD